LTNLSKHRAAYLLVIGMIAGAILCLVAILLSGLTVVSHSELNQQTQLIDDLQQENQELTDDLFNYQGPDALWDPADLPYDESADANVIVATAREQALRDGKFLMITFGANWCADCRTLYQTLKAEDVAAYTDRILHFANIDVGKFNRNRDVAEELGIDLKRGIPVAVFFDPEGQKIGTTNAGQLEPARLYTSKQILKFVRDIVEKSLIAAPDSIQ